MLCGASSVQLCEAKATCQRPWSPLRCLPPPHAGLPSLLQACPRGRRLRTWPRLCRQRPRQLRHLRPSHGSQATIPQHSAKHAPKSAAHESTTHKTAQFAEAPSQGRREVWYVGVGMSHQKHTEQQVPVDKAVQCHNKCRVWGPCPSLGTGGIGAASMTHALLQGGHLRTGDKDPSPEIWRSAHCRRRW